MKTSKKILIVDDEEDILEFLAYNFKKQGFNVVVAKDGRKGFSVAKKEKPDLIISDMLMPEIDGIEFCKAVRQEYSIKDTPFLMLTAVNDDYKVLYAISSGADQYATKPIRFPYLLAMVNEMLEEIPSV
jgi:two-component system alkaline phosphatase synthesis response regulator PhoP